MHLDISPKTKARVAARAKEKGLSIDAFLKRLLDDAGDPTGGAVPELPVRHLGVIGSLHRRDIYA
jgi:hypothetical protein